MNDAYIINDFLFQGAQHGLLPGARLTREDEERLSSKQMGTQSGDARLGTQAYLRL